MLEGILLRTGKVLLLGFVLVVFSSGLSAASPSTDVYRVVVLGSSTAVGAAAQPAESSWVNKFKRYLSTVFQSYEVVNLAVGGFTTFNVMPNGYQRPSPWDANSSLNVAPDYNITKALSLNPSLILINLPTNDCDLLAPVAQQLSNFDALIDAAQGQGVPVYLSTTQPRNSNLAVRNLLIEMRDAITSRYGGRVMDFWTGIANPDGTIKPLYDADGTHLNNNGHEVLYQRARSTVNFTLPVTVSPDVLSFGNRQVGVSATLPVTLTNGSPSTVAIDNIYTMTAHFVADRGSANLAPGASVDVMVTFTAPGLGAFTDTLFLHNSSSLTLMKVPLAGIAPAPVIDADPNTIDFGDVRIQTGKTITLTLHNADLNSGSFSNVTSQSGRFVAAPTSGTINRLSSLTVAVTFTPDGFGVFRDTVRFNGAVSNGSFGVPVVGHSSIPELSASAQTLDFGDVALGVAKTLQLTLSNSSANPLVIDATANTHPQFYVEPASGTIPPHGTSTLSVTFIPTGFGMVTDTIRVISNASVSPFSIPMAGRSPLPGISLSRTALSFPLVGQGDGVTRSLFVRNTGVSAFTIQTFQTRTPHFTVVTPLPLAVPAADSALLTVCFAPKGAGDLRDTVTLLTDAGSAEFAVSGSSPTSYLRAVPAPVHLGSVKTGTTFWKSCMLSVESPQPAFTVSIDSLRTRTSVFFLSDPGMRYVLAKGDSVRIVIGFRPTAYQRYDDTLLIYNNTALAVARVPMSGTGDVFTMSPVLQEEVPSAFALHQNYPNPFNPATEISFAVPHQERVVVQVFDVLGQEVATVVDDVREAGTYRERFDASGLPSGVYIYRMCAGEFTAARRMIMLK